MAEEMFILEPEYTKCVIEVETWKKDSSTIKRAIGWRYGKILVGDFTEEEIKDVIKARDILDRVCVSEKFDFIDQKLQDSFTDDLSFSEDMPEEEINRLNNLFIEEGETVFEEEGWEIYDTDLYFESKIKITTSGEDTL